MSAMEKVLAAWPHPAPDWVEALARRVDETSQNATARELGYSAGVVHNVLRNIYGASTDTVEERVRGRLMAETVSCPVLGEIGTHACQEWRKRSRSFRNGNSMDVTMYRACQRCPRNREAGHGDA